MKNKKSTNNSKGGIYIAVCCFAVLAAAIGYAGRSNNNSSETKPKNYSSADIVSKNTSPSLEIPKQIPKAKNNPEIVIKDYEEKSVLKEPEIDTKNENKEIAASKTTQVEDTKFLMPVEGKIVCGFSGDELIFNKFLSDWRSHNGIDISCDKNSAIYASADGIVSEILDNSMGKSVLIDHENGYVTVYSNMSEEIEVKTGDKLEAGALIGKVSDSNPSDFTQDYHLHFEILHNDKHVDPQELLNK